MTIVGMDNKLQRLPSSRRVPRAEPAAPGGPEALDTQQATDTENELPLPLIRRRERETPHVVLLPEYIALCRR